MQRDKDYYTRCCNCHRDFADHDYIKGSIDDYKCPEPHVECFYGFFHGGDPREFHPDYESCSEQEIANWKEACDKATELESARDLPCPSGWIRTPEFTAHMLVTPFGIGTYTYKQETFYEPSEMDFVDTDLE